MTKWIEHKVCERQLQFAHNHAKLMSEGASTFSFKSGTKQNSDVYMIGKIGELAVYKFLTSSGFEVVHNPFRDNYQKFNWNDDFQIRLQERIKQIEVRCKARNVEPNEQYECCSDCIKPDIDYIFTSYNRKTNVVHILGWADFSTWARAGFETIKGTTNNNFAHKVTEFNIKIKDLNPIYEYRRKEA